MRKSRLIQLAAGFSFIFLFILFSSSSSSSQRGWVRWFGLDNATNKPPAKNYLAAGEESDAKLKGGAQAEENIPVIPHAGQQEGNDATNLLGLAAAAIELQEQQPPRHEEQDIEETAPRIPPPTSTNGNHSPPPLPHRQQHHKDDNNNPIPKKIWTTTSSSSLSRSAIQGWKRLNPDYTITVLDPASASSVASLLRGNAAGIKANNAGKSGGGNNNNGVATQDNNHIDKQAALPSNYESMTLEQRSEWIRLAILLQEGGIWIDSNFVMTQPIDCLIEVVKREKSDGLMFYLNRWTTLRKFKYFNNWLIIAKPNAPLIREWLREFTRCFVEFGMQDSYLTHLKTTFGVEQYSKLLQKNPAPSQSKQQVALQKVLQLDQSNPDSIIPAFSGIEATNSLIGPLFIHDMAGWNNDLFARLFVEMWTKPSYPAFIWVGTDEQRWISFFIRDMEPSNDINRQWSIWNSFSIFNYYAFGLPVVYSNSVYCKFISPSLSSHCP